MKKVATFWVVFVLLLIVLTVAVSLSACSSHHYFSINAEEMTNPAIMYSDSTNLTNPF